MTRLPLLNCCVAWRSRACGVPITEPLTLDNTTYPAGTWVIPTDQEFAAFAPRVLDVQKYPDLRQYPGGPP